MTDNPSNTPLVTGPNFEQVDAADILITVPDLEDAIPGSLGEALAVGGGGGESPAELAAQQNLTFDANSGVLTMTGVDGATMYSVTINPTPPATVAVYTPAWAIASSTSIVLRGTWTGPTPTQFDYTLNASAGSPTWVTVTTGNTVINSSLKTFAITIGTLSTQWVTKGNLAVRNTTNTNAIGIAPGGWLISSTSPNSPSAGTLVFATQIANPSLIVQDSNGVPSTLRDWKPSSSQYLYYGPTSPPSTLGGTYIFNGTPTHSPIYNRTDGADSGQTALDMAPATNANAVKYVTTANFYDAGPLGGPNDTLISMANTSAANVGSFVTVQAVYIPPASQDLFACPTIWNQYGALGATANYISMGRIHSGSFAAQYNMAGLGQSFFATAADATFGGTFSGGWYVITVQKSGATFRVRYRNSTTVPSWATVTITQTTGGFTASNFEYGGGSPPDPNNQLSGNSYAKLGDMFCLTGVPTDADMQAIEKVAGSSVGLTLSASA